MGATSGLRYINNNGYTNSVWKSPTPVAARQRTIDEPGHYTEFNNDNDQTGINPTERDWPWFMDTSNEGVNTGDYNFPDEDAYLWGGESGESGEIKAVDS